MIEVGVVGAGNVAKIFHLPILSRNPDIKLSYIADVDEANLSQLDRVYGSQTIVADDAASLPQTDIVLLSIPVGARDSYIQEFGSRDTDIFVEKPFARDVTAHDDYLEQVEKIGCNYMREQFATTELAATLISTETFGSLESIVISQGGIVGTTGKTPEAYNPELRGGGILMEKGCHLLSQLTTILDRPLRIEDAHIVYSDDIDVHVDAQLVAEDIPVEFKLSLLEDVGNDLTCSFEYGDVEFNPANPGDNVTITPHGVSVPLGHIESRSSYPDTVAQAMHSRWRTFIETPAAEFDTRLYTRRNVTQLIEEMYKTATEEFL